MSFIKIVEPCKPLSCPPCPHHESLHGWFHQQLLKEMAARGVSRKKQKPKVSQLISLSQGLVTKEHGLRCEQQYNTGRSTVDAMAEQSLWQ